MREKLLTGSVKYQVQVSFQLAFMTYTSGNNKLFFILQLMLLSHTRNILGKCCLQAAFTINLNTDITHWNMKLFPEVIKYYPTDQWLKSKFKTEHTKQRNK